MTSQQNAAALFERQAGSAGNAFAMPLTPKEAALESIRDLPESATFEDIMNRVYELQQSGSTEPIITQMGLWSD